MIFKIFYWKDIEMMVSGFLKEANVTEKTLLESHVHIHDIEATDLEDVFDKMQGFNWSPNSEANSLIEEKGIKHVSMSVGDVVQDQTGKYFQALSIGWDELN